MGGTSNLSNRDKEYYEAMRGLLHEELELKYSKNNLADIRRAAEYFKNNFNYATAEEDYGAGGAKAIREYVSQLKADYNKVSNSIKSAVKKYEDSRGNIEITKYDEEKARRNAEKRKKKFFATALGRK